MRRQQTGTQQALLLDRREKRQLLAAEQVMHAVL